MEQTRFLERTECMFSEKVTKKGAVHTQVYNEGVVYHFRETEIWSLRISHTNTLIPVPRRPDQSTAGLWKIGTTCDQSYSGLVYSSLF